MFLVVTPVIAAIVASPTLINVIIPWFFQILTKKLHDLNNLELTSVCVALGTMFVFVLVAGVFAANIPPEFSRRESDE